MQLKLTFSVSKKNHRIAWHGTKVGTFSTAFKSPYAGADLHLVVRALDQLQALSQGLSAADITRLQALNLLAEDGELSTAFARAVGRQLYTALTRDRNALGALATLKNKSVDSDRSLYVRMHFPPEASELAALPWELLWDQEDNPLLIALPGQVSFSRHLDLPIGRPTLRRIAQPLRILPIITRSSLSDPDRLKEEAARNTAWEPLVAAGKVELLRPLTPATFDSIRGFFESDPRPDIVHIVAQGTFADDAGHLILDTAQGGFARVPVNSLASYLRGASLVTLMVCQSSMVGIAEGPKSGRPQGLLTGGATALSAIGVPLVLGMQLQLPVDSAYKIVESFYGQVAQGKSVQEALYWARKRLYSEERAGAAWFVPTLYVNTEDVEPHYLVELPAAVAAPAPVVAPAGDSLEGLGAYLEWVEVTCQRPSFAALSAVLASSDLQDAPLEKLYTPLEARCHIQTSGSSAEYSSPDVLATCAGRRRILLTGVPGSGKSTLLHVLALHMARACMARDKRKQAEHLIRITQAQDWHEPQLPLLIDLKSFAEQFPEKRPPGGDAAHYLSHYLASQTLFSLEAQKRLGMLLERGEVLLLLDGLDQVPDDKWDAVRSFIMTLDGLPERARILITCRTRDRTRRSLPGLELFHCELQHLSIAVRQKLLVQLLDRRRATELEQMLERKAFYPLTTTPLLVTMLVLVYLELRAALPDQRVVLYERTLHVLMQGWYKQTGTSEAPREQGLGWLGVLIPRLELLCLIAARLQDQLPTAAPLVQAELREIVDTFLDYRVVLTEDQKDQALQALLAEFNRDSELLLVSGGGRLSPRNYQFTHPTLQEYLAGHALLLSHLPLPGESPETSRDLISRVLRRVDREAWRAPLIFLAERMIFEHNERLLLLLIEQLLAQADGAQPTPATALAGELFAVFRKAHTMDAERDLDALTGQLTQRIERSRPVAVGWGPELAQRTALELNGIAYWSERFALALHPVTVDEFRTFVAAGAYRQAEGTLGGNHPDGARWWTRGGQRWLKHQMNVDPRFAELSADPSGATYQPEGLLAADRAFPNQPITWISWHEANAYCRWLTEHADTSDDHANRWLFRLPTEHEWELATAEARLAADERSWRTELWQWCASPGDREGSQRRYQDDVEQMLNDLAGERFVLRREASGIASTEPTATTREADTPDRQKPDTGFRIVRCRLRLAEGP